MMPVAFISGFFVLLASTLNASICLSYVFGFGVTGASDEVDTLFLGFGDLCLVLVA